MKAHGVRMVPKDPELRLKVFATALGTDRGETLVGLPAFQAPILNVPFPEIALFKWVRNRGQTECVFAFDGKTDEFVDQLRPASAARSWTTSLSCSSSGSTSDLDTPVP